MLNISKHIYAGWNNTTTTDLLEAEVIPYGDSSNEKNKLSSIAKKYNTVIDYENIPLPGFTLFKSNRKRWGSADKTWLIIDPRGFLARITNENLESILHVTGITEGLIQEKCVWARESSRTTMILVPQSSPLYAEAIENTDLIDSKVNIKDVQIGDTVLLQNKLIGTYMGVLSLYCPLRFSYQETALCPGAHIRRQVVKIEPGKYHYQTDCKILKILTKADAIITREESALSINTDIANNQTYFTSGTDMNSRYWGGGDEVKFVSHHAVSKPEITFEPVDKDEALTLFNAGSIYNNGVLLLQNDKITALVDHPYNLIQSAHSATSFCVDVVTEITDTQISIEKTPMFGNIKTRYSFDMFTKFYRIIKNVKTETYI
jgi:hypothetical protein